MTIEVTNEDIQAGWDWAMVRIPEKIENDQLRCSLCPVAVSLKRTFKTNKVSAETYRLIVNNTAYRTPEIVSDWMELFDRGQDMKPFSYELI